MDHYRQVLLEEEQYDCIEAYYIDGVWNAVKLTHVWHVRIFAILFSIIAAQHLN